jgi:hypothetical protein
MQIEYAKKDLLAKLAPLLPNVLIEIGMEQDQAIKICEKYQSFTRVEGHYAQIDYNLEQAQKILSDLPPQFRSEFMRLTYQWVGPSSLLRDEVSEKLLLSRDQRSNVQTVYLDYAEQLAPANRPDFHYKVSTEEEYKYHRRTLEIENKRDIDLLSILTPQQRFAWDNLLGTPSKALANFRDYCEENSPGNPNKNKASYRSVDGRVLFSGVPLVGADVILEGTSLGAITDSNGYYKIMYVTKVSSVLKVYLAGYPTRIIGPINTLQDTTIDIVIGGYSSAACKESLSVIIGRINNDVGESINDAQIFWFPYCGTLSRKDSGNFLISHLGAGSFSVLVFRSDFKPKLIEHMRLDGQDTARIKIRLENESYKPEPLPLFNRQ